MTVYRDTPFGDDDEDRHILAITSSDTAWTGILKIHPKTRGEGIFISGHKDSDNWVGLTREETLELIDELWTCLHPETWTDCKHDPRPPIVTKNRRP